MTLPRIENLRYRDCDSLCVNLEGAETKVID